MNYRLPLLAVLCLSLGLIACDRPAPTVASPALAPIPNAPPIKKLPTTQVVLAGRPFQLEIAIDDADMERGMMYRTSMGDGEGMIFVFPYAAPQAFWMKNTLLPLDIAYLDDDGIILNIPKMYPRDMSSTPSAGNARYAIELKQGTADRIGLKPGDRVVLPATFR